MQSIKKSLTAVRLHDILVSEIRSLKRDYKYPNSSKRKVVYISTIEDGKHIMQGRYVKKRGEVIGVQYIKNRNEKPKLPKAHCRHCHYTWTLRTEKAPDKCGNNRGYTDTKTGIKYPPCANPRKWDQWPDNFNLDSPETCMACKRIYLEEQEEMLELKPRAVNE